MAFLSWTPDLSVGITEIDNQHKKLFETINHFYEGLANPADNKKAIGELITAVKDYTVYHFKTEESYLEKFHYPETPKQKQLHREFIAKIDDVKSRFDSGKMVISMEITAFLKDWITSHIKLEDMKYRPCLQSNGMK